MVINRFKVAVAAALAAGSTAMATKKIDVFDYGIVGSCPRSGFLA